MKKKQAVLCLAFSLVLMVGCARAAEKTEPIMEPEIEAVDQIDETEDHDSSESAEDESAETVKAAEADEADNAGEVSGEEELEGSVVSINSDEKSVEINEIVTEEYEDGSQTAVELVGVGSSSNMITVQFNENARYTVRNVKNAGINPEDVSDSEGSFSDIEEGRTILLKGHYEGEKFLASNVVIYNIN